MGFFKRDAGPPVRAVSATWLQWPTLCPGSRQSVIGESHYQDALEWAAGGRTFEPMRKLVTAQLVREPTNPHDHNAVRVDLGGRTVGYIARKDAPRFHGALAAVTAAGQMATCRAWITGGWDKGATDRGHFGLMLNLHDHLKPSPPDLPFLPDGKMVTVAKSVDCQDHLDRICGGANRAVTAQLAVDDDGSVWVWTEGSPAGRLTPAKSHEYLATVQEAIAAGFPTTCQGFVGPGKTRTEMKVMLGTST